MEGECPNAPSMQIAAAPTNRTPRNTGKLYFLQNAVFLAAKGPVSRGPGSSAAPRMQHRWNRRKPFATKSKLLQCGPFTPVGMFRRCHVSNRNARLRCRCHLRHVVNGSLRFLDDVCHLPDGSLTFQHRVRYVLDRVCHVLNGSLRFLDDVCHDREGVCGIRKPE
jgi:hypothetical protein